mmetsp:Transcript_65861/g.106793  ORF Transcript_65861/g.106793 Transcript_65861/m.106793 type:complete len:183 (+) Transcript_65861:25-573(+)
MIERETKSTMHLVAGGSASSYMVCRRHSTCLNEKMAVRSRFVLCLMVAVLLVYPTAAVNCYHGTVTEGATDVMPVDAQFWLDRAGDARVARPVNCSKRVGDAYDTCSVFCRHYRMLSSEEPLVVCRRFCQTWEQCNQSRFNEWADCESERLVPRGNGVCQSFSGAGFVLLLLPLRCERERER